MRQNKVPAQPGNEKDDRVLRVEKLPRLTGKVTKQIMEELKCFPLRKKTRPMVGQSDLALMVGSLALIWNPTQTVLQAGRESFVCLLDIPSLQNFVKRIQSAHLKDSPEFSFCFVQLELNPLGLSQPLSGSVVFCLSLAPNVSN